MIDEPVDQTYWDSVLDDPRINDLPPMSDEKYKRLTDNLLKEPELHWSEREKLGYKAQPREEWELGDQMADHSDQQGYDIEEERED